SATRRGRSLAAPRTRAYTTRGWRRAPRFRPGRDRSSRQGFRDERRDEERVVLHVEEVRLDGGDTGGLRDASSDVERMDVVAVPAHDDHLEVEGCERGRHVRERPPRNGAQSALERLRIV